jgi:hypothetical protein
MKRDRTEVRRELGRKRRDASIVFMARRGRLLSNLNHVFDIGGVHNCNIVTMDHGDQQCRRLPISRLPT